MSEVAVSASVLDDYIGSETDFILRIKNRLTFLASTGTPVLGESSGAEDFFFDVPCTVSGGQIHADAFTLHSTTNALTAPPDGDGEDVFFHYRFDLHTTDGKYHSTLYKRIQVPPTPNPTTLAALIAFNEPPPIPASLLASIYAFIANLLANLAKATELLFGMVRLSVPADDPDDPIAVGINDPIITAGSSGNETDTYRSNPAFGTLAAAIAAATGNTLAFTAEQPITVDTVLPRDIRTRVGGLGKFNISSTKTLTIENLIETAVKLYVGPGKLIRKNAASLPMSNWTGPFGQPTTLNGGINNSVVSITVADGTIGGTAPFYRSINSEAILVTGIAGNVWTVQRGVDGTSASSHSNAAPVRAYITTKMWEGMTDSASIVGGVDIIAPPGHWATTGNINAISCATIKGSGGHPDSVLGTTFWQIADNTSTFNIGDSRYCAFEDLTIDCTEMTNAKCVDIAGTGSVALHPSFNRVTLRGGTIGMDCRDTLGNYSFLVINLTVTNSIFIGQTVSCFHSNIPNTSYNFDTISFTPYPNQTSKAVHLNYCGQVSFNHITSNGVNIDTRCKHTTISAINTTTNLVTATGHGCTIGQLEPVTIFNATPANLPVGTININRLTAVGLERQTLAFKAIDANTGYMYLNPKHAFLVDEVDYRFNFTTAGSGTNVLRTTVPLFSGISSLDHVTTVSTPYCGIHIQNTLYGVTINDWQDEGFPISMLVDFTFQKERAITISDSSVMQGLVLLNSQCKVLFDGLTAAAGSVKDYATAIDTSSPDVEVKGASCFFNYDVSAYTDMGGTVQPNPPSMFNFVGNGIVWAAENPQKGRNEYGAPHFTRLEHPWDGYSDAIQFLGRNRNTFGSALAKWGVMEPWEKELSRYYGFYHLDAAFGEAIPYAYQDQWFQIRGDLGKTTAQTGVSVFSHFAKRGRDVNDLQIELTSSGGVTTLDGSLAEDYYFDTLGEDTTINLDATAGREVVQIEHKYIYIPATATNRTITWGSGFVTPGHHVLNTRWTPGVWVCKFDSFGGNNLRLDGKPFFIPSGVDATADPLYYWRGASLAQQVISDGTGYLCDNGAVTVLTLPLKAFVGDVIEVKGMNSGGWRIAQNASQYINLDGVTTTTPGTGGKLESVESRAAIKLVCTIQDTAWEPLSMYLTVTPT